MISAGPSTEQMWLAETLHPQWSMVDSKTHRHGGFKPWHDQSQSVTYIKPPATPYLPYSVSKIQDWTWGKREYESKNQCVHALAIGHIHRHNHVQQRENTLLQAMFGTCIGSCRERSCILHISITALSTLVMSRHNNMSVQFLMCRWTKSETSHPHDNTPQPHHLGKHAPSNFGLKVPSRSTKHPYWIHSLHDFLVIMEFPWTSTSIATSDTSE